MSNIRNNIFELLDSRDDIITSLSPERSEKLETIKKELRNGFIETIVSSIKDYVEKSPEIKENILPGSVGAFLLGCISSNKEIDEDNIFIATTDFLEQVLVKESDTAVIYFSQGKRELSSNEKEILKSKGIVNIINYIFDEKNKQYILEGSKSNTELIVLVLCLALALCLAYIFYPKVFT